MPIAPNSAEARDIAYHIHGQTDLKAHEEKGPKIISKGDGVHVYDDDGKEFIEGLAGLPAVPAREGGRQPGTPGAEVVLGGSRPFSRSSRPFTRCA